MAVPGRHTGAHLTVSGLFEGEPDLLEMILEVARAAEVEHPAIAVVV